MKKPSSRTLYQPETAALLLRVGLAVAFLYAAIDAFREPAAWISFVPSMLTRFIDAKLALDLLSVGQIVLAVVLLSGKFIKYAAGLAVLMLVGIVVFNTGAFLITFRDLSLAFAAVALIFLDKS